MKVSNSLKIKSYQEKLSKKKKRLSSYKKSISLIHSKKSDHIVSLGVKRYKSSGKLDEIDLGLDLIDKVQNKDILPALALSESSLDGSVSLESSIDVWDFDVQGFGLAPPLNLLIKEKK